MMTMTAKISFVFGVIAFIDNFTLNLSSSLAFSGILIFKLKDFSPPAGIK